jgi:hypothetical protein
LRLLPGPADEIRFRAVFLQLIAYVLLVILCLALNAIAWR